MRARRGVSLIETMVSAAILGIGVISLANTFFSTEKGITLSKKRVAAMEIAQQRVERFAARPLADVPQCVVLQGCRFDRYTYAPLKSAVGSFACSEMQEGMSSRPEGSSLAATGEYRVDTVVEPHPDPNQQVGAITVSVNVCWVNGDGEVQEVQAQRLLVPEV